MNNFTNLPLGILEEIGFEGLEGITVEGLWKRIGVRLRVTLPLNQRIKTEIWNFIKKVKCLQFYSLQEEREPLKIFDRMEYKDLMSGPIETVS